IATTTPIVGQPITCPQTIVAYVCYHFSGPPGGWYDPATASGYTYAMTGQSLFTEILNFPSGFDQPFDVTSPGCSIPGSFSPGDSVDFVSLCGHGVSQFSVTGIDPTFDPSNPTAFPIQLLFDTPTADFVAAPLGPAGPVPAPEPTTLALLGVG